MTRIMLDVEFYIETCCVEKCGITWAVPTSFNKNRRDDHKSYYCPNGHGQYYVKESEAERLKKQLNTCSIAKNTWRDRAERRERSQRSFRGHITRMKNAMKKDGSAEGS